MARPGSDRAPKPAGPGIGTSQGEGLTLDKHGQAGLEPDLDFHRSFPRIVLKVETQSLADELHGTVFHENVGGDSFDFLVPSDLDQPLQQLRAQALALKIISHQKGCINNKLRSQGLFDGRVGKPK